MNNADKPASSQYGKFDKDSQGLTKREYFAALAMQGFIESIDLERFGTDTIARMACKQADALEEK